MKYTKLKGSNLEINGDGQYREKVKVRTLSYPIWTAVTPDRDVEADLAIAFPKPVKTKRTKKNTKKEK